MDRLSKLREEAAGSRDSTLETSAGSEAYLTANEDSSKFFSLSEDYSSFNLSPTKDVSLDSTAVSPEKTNNDQLISNLSPITNKSDLDSYKFDDKQIEAANILSGGVDIFEDNDNSYDGNELVIDDNVEIDDKNEELKLIENSGDQESAVESKDTEVVLQIDGNSVNAINIGNGLYLYRKAGEEELAAVQIIADEQDQPTFKFLKVRENAEGNLEVYEEIEIEVPNQVPVKGGKTSDKSASHVPIKGINKVIADPSSNKVVDRKIQNLEVVPTASTSKNDSPSNVAVSDTKSEVNLNGKMVKINETRKSPVIHSTPNKEGIPLTKTMVNQQLHPNRQLDNVKTIEVHIDTSKQRVSDTKSKDVPEDNKPANIISKESEKPVEDAKNSEEIKDNELTTTQISKLKPDTEITVTKSNEVELLSTQIVESEPAKAEITEESTEVQTDDTPSYSKPSDSETKSPGSSETKTESQSVNALTTTDESPIHKIKEIEVAEPKPTESLVPKPEEEISQAKPKEIEEPAKVTEEPKPDESACEKLSDTKSKESTETKPDIISEKYSETVSSQTAENLTLNVPESARVEKDEVDSGAISKSKPIEEATGAENVTHNVPESAPVEKDEVDSAAIPKSKPVEEATGDNSKIYVTTEKEADEKRNTKTDESTVKSLEKNQNEKPLFNKKEQILHNIKSNTVSSDISQNETQNESEKTIGSTKDEKPAKYQLEQKLQQNHADESHPKTQNIIQPQLKMSTLSEIKIEQNSKESPKNSETAMTKSDKIPPLPSKKVEIVEDIILVPQTRKQIVDQKADITSKNVKIENRGSERGYQNSIFGRNTTAESKMNFPLDKQPQTDKHQIKKVEQIVPQNILNLTKSFTKEENFQNPNTMKQEPLKPQTMLSKIEPVSKQTFNVTPAVVQKKPEIKNDTAKRIVLDKKPISDNNDGVPFGKWTTEHRQDFLNKIKETKVPVNTSNTKQIKQANDLNRRDILQKIDSQRQSLNAIKTNVKHEGPRNQTFALRETKASVKAEAPAPKAKPLLLKKPDKPHMPQASKGQTNLTVTSSYMLKSEGPSRNEYSNQDLIDKTIEGIINRVVTAKPQDLKQNIPREPTHPPREIAFAGNSKPKSKQPSMLLDAIEMKMNELHGIPFVERPPHQLPKVYNRDIKTYSKSDLLNSSNKSTKIPSLLPVAAPSQPKPVNSKDNIIDLDSEEEVIEHVPVTGDIDLHNNLNKPFKPLTFAPTAAPHVPHKVDLSKKEQFITEKEFDKFYSRNSVAYNSELFPNTKITSSSALDQGSNNIASQLPMQKHMPTNKIEITSKLVPVDEDVFGKNYPSKLQVAYQTALSTKRQMEPPITIIEDKPVKVVFMDSNAEYSPVKLNVQGPQLSPSKKPVLPRTPELDSAASTGDSLDSDIMDSIDAKLPDESKAKIKHQRKQVLTPVEAPELELISPSDLGLEFSPKKKRRTEDSKSLVPKKTYLLGRNTPTENHIPPDLAKDIPKEIAPVNSLIIGRSDAASAIDNLVKAAELLETQSAFKPTSLSTTSPDSPQTSTPTPVKRGRGRPRKYPLPEGTPTPDKPKVPSPQKKPRLIDAKQRKRVSTTDEDEDSSSSDGAMVKENWTLGKINENVVCPICNKLFRSENVVFKHVKHCTGPSPNRSESDKRSLRTSRYSRDSQSVDSKLDDTDGESDRPLKKNTPKKRKSEELSPDRNDQVIVIEDTPLKDKKEKAEEPKPHEPRKTKAQYKTSSLSCEHCGKTFRQLSYLVNHRLLHKKTNSESLEQGSDKKIFSCEVCKKEFRKLHHLVQHRIIHNPSSAPSRLSRKNSVELRDNKGMTDQESKPNDDQSAAFRCEPCDKSFRKLHHLVEHRETHDGINRQKNILMSHAPEKPEPPPQCDICKKTFRKLHHLSEHKEQHMDMSNEKSDEKGAKGALSAKDIIHECSLCYMVFPNEHSLNKHFINCQRKKKQAAAKKAKLLAEAAEAAENKEQEKPLEVEPVASPPPTSPEPQPTPNTKIVTEVKENVEIEKPSEVINIDENAESSRDQKSLSKEKEIEPVVEKTVDEVPPKPSKRDLEPPSALEKPVDQKPEVPPKVKKIEEPLIKEIKETEPIKKKTPVKEKEKSTPAKRKSNLPLARIKETAAVESSDDDEVRYMLNPDYTVKKPEPEVATTEGQVFMKVRAKKRNSLQFERPNSKDFAKRRTSLQNPSKVTRKSKSTENSADVPKIDIATAKTNIAATDSDDSDVKYSFPKKPAESEKSGKTPKTPVMKEKRKSIVLKRKTLSGIAKRKSLGKLAATKPTEKVPPTKEIKKRRGEVEHRCDCGQLFSSAALLSRHTTLAHTPPRNRRRRTDSPSTVAALKPVTDAPKLTTTAPKSTSAAKPTATATKLAATAPKTVTTAPKPAATTSKPADSKKTEQKSADTPKRKPGRPPGKTPRKSVQPESAAPKKTLRRLTTFSGVPRPEKMKRIVDKLKNE